MKEQNQSEQRTRISQYKEYFLILVFLEMKEECSRDGNAIQDNEKD